MKKETNVKEIIKNNYIKDIEILIPDVKDIFELYKDIRSGKKEVLDRFDNQHELRNLRVLNSQLTELKELIDNLINKY